MQSRLQHLSRQATFKVAAEHQRDAAGLLGNDDGHSIVFLRQAERGAADGVQRGADDATVDAFADAILTLDDSVPTGTYVDMCSRLPVVDPTQIKVPTLILRGEFDGIASMQDLIDFYVRLPHTNKQFSVMKGISHASFQQKNYKMVYHILHSYLTMPDPIYEA